MYTCHLCCVICAMTAHVKMWRAAGVSVYTNYFPRVPDWMWISAINSTDIHVGIMQMLGKFKTCVCVQLLMDLPMSNCCSQETRLHFGLRRPRNVRLIVNSDSENVTHVEFSLAPEVHQSNHWILQNESLKIGREQHDADSSDRSLDLIMLVSSTTLLSLSSF